jgi:branched-chain amino acid aminotransferase
MQLSKSGVIWFNGRFVPWEQARVHVLSHALHYATSVFEGLRAYETPKGLAVVCLREHVERLFGSCKILDLPLDYTREQLAEAICATVQKNERGSCYIRPIVFRGLGVLGVDPTGSPVDVAIATWPHGAHYGAEGLAKGIDVCVSSWRRMAPDTHPAMAKAAANYLNSELAVMEARRLGFQDAILLDVDGFACEGHGSNLFVVLGGVVHTPPLGESILAGVTRRCILTLLREARVEVREQRIAREMLIVADEVFLTGTAAEVTPVRAVDGKPVGAGGRGPITERLQREFLGIVRGEREDRHGWLTRVAEQAPVVPSKAR